MKLCKDCKWFKKEFLVFINNGHCTNPEVIQEKGDVVTGIMYASIARDYGPCFRAGTYWEPNQ